MISTHNKYHGSTLDQVTREAVVHNMFCSVNVESCQYLQQHKFFGLSKFSPSLHRLTEGSQPMNRWHVQESVEPC